MASTILFVHTNFPAQFRHLARHLAQDPGYDVIAFGSNTARDIPGVRLFRYHPHFETAPNVHPFAARFDGECVRAEQIMYLATHLRSEGIVPDVIMVHPGWGEALPLRVVFPTARICAYCEYYFKPRASDLDFDPEFPAFGMDGQVRTNILNVTPALALLDADLGLAPTQWQKETFPAVLQPMIEVIHDGIDTDEVRPDSRAALTIDGRTLRAGDEIVTYVARNLEPYRGIHSFMRAAAKILRTRPRAQILLVGGHGASYGSPAPKGSTWFEIFRREIGGTCDLSRLHALGTLSRADYLNVLRVSRAHVYLTYPFVPSWSLAEAMAMGCAIVASDTAPVREFIDSPDNGYLVSFFDTDAIASRVIDILAHTERHDAVRRAARARAIERFDLNRVSLPKQKKLIELLARRGQSRTGERA